MFWYPTFAYLQKKFARNIEKLLAKALIETYNSKLSRRYKENLRR